MGKFHTSVYPTVGGLNTEKRQNQGKCRSGARSLGFSAISGKPAVQENPGATGKQCRRLQLPGCDSAHYHRGLPAAAAVGCDPHPSICSGTSRGGICKYNHPRGSKGTRDPSSLHTFLPPLHLFPSTQAILITVEVPAILRCPAAIPGTAAALAYQGASNPGGRSSDNEGTSQ